MSIDSRICYVAKCDVCGNQIELDSGVIWHHDAEADAMNSARDSDWRQCEDGQLRCADCFDRDGVAEVETPRSN